MTDEFFNALPLPARRFISEKKGCASCGTKNDLDKFYKQYLNMERLNYFTLKNGALPTTKGVLYPIHQNDNEDVLKEKLKLACFVFDKNPEKFTTFEEAKIKEIFTPEKKQVKNETKNGTSTK